MIFSIYAHVFIYARIFITFIINTYISCTQATLNFCGETRFSATTRILLFIRVSQLQIVVCHVWFILNFSLCVIPPRGRINEVPSSVLSRVVLRAHVRKTALPSTSWTLFRDKMQLPSVRLATPTTFVCCLQVRLLSLNTMSKLLVLLIRKCKSK